jgi:hypothetical protein
MSTPITAAGSYGAGDYILANDISAGGTVLHFTGDAKLDLNGKKVEDTSTGNGDTFGILSAGKLDLYDGVGSGKVKGGWAGVKVLGPGSRINVDIERSRYIGVYFEGAHGSKVVGGLISEIGGVTNEPYAIGVQVGTCAGVEVIGVRFKNIYRQTNGPGSLGDHLGEGLAVNFSATATNGRLIDSSYSNDEFFIDTIGAFLGIGGSHLIDGFRVHNIFKPAQRAVANNSDIKNVVATYSTVAVAPPPPPPSGGFDFVLNDSLASSFGSVNGKDIEVEIARAALTNSPGGVQNIKVHLRGKADEPITYDFLYVRLGNGSETQLLVGGQTSWTVPAGSYAIAEAAFVDDKTSPIIFRSAHSGGSSADALAANASFPNAVTRHRYFGGSWGSIAGYLSGIEKIEMDGFPE